MDMVRDNLGYVVMGLFLGWMLWRRLLAPKLSGVLSISASEYMKLRDQPLSVVDVRTMSEWAAGHAPEALHIPLSEIGGRQDEISQGKPVIVVCATGNRSAVAATTLARAGFKPVYNFSGGMSAWQGGGLPVSRSR